MQVEALPLSQNGKPDRHRARSLLMAPTDEAAADSVQSSKVLAIYLSVLGRPPEDGANASVDFISLGLRPQHLKSIATRLREELSVQLSPGQLLRCRNAQDVEALLAAQPA